MREGENGLHATSPRLAEPFSVEASTGSQGQDLQIELQGTIMSVGAISFVIKLSNGDTKTVTVSSATHFSRPVHKLSHLKVGDSVNVHGTIQNNGTVAATSVDEH
jgi:hypothetical protein